jgi:metallophosphoesterase (TIGR00282 family)
MRILMVGDIVGNPGVGIVERALPQLILTEQLDLVIANAENASGGSGLTPGAYRRLRAAGVDVITMGDHIYKKLDILKVMADGAPILKPANYPPEAPGLESVVVTARDGTPVAVLSLMGRLYMRPVDCPFKAADRVLKSLEGQAACIAVDVHAEATGDKAVLGRYLDGKVSAVFGTHTHVPTADERILPGGAAFITDVGMTGPYESILGRQIDRVLETNVTFVPTMFDIATEDVRLAGAVVDVDPATGRSRSIRRIMLAESSVSQVPANRQVKQVGSETGRPEFD